MGLGTVGCREPISQPDSSFELHDNHPRLSVFKQDFPVG